MTSAGAITKTFMTLKACSVSQIEELNVKKTNQVFFFATVGINVRLLFAKEGKHIKLISLQPGIILIHNLALIHLSICRESSLDRFFRDLRRQSLDNEGLLGSLSRRMLVYHNLRRVKPNASPVRKCRNCGLEHPKSSLKGLGSI